VDDFLNNRLPRPNLRNLEIYHEIGSGLEHNNDGNAEPLDYHSLYRAKLREWHEYSAVAADGRLWLDEDAV
jgi:hypothetical protein